MRQLLWKEFREKRLWSIPMAASVVGVVALGQGYTFCGDVFTFTSWVIPSAVAALLFGMGAYSGETAWGTADFLFSRPISWKKVAAAKLVFGIGVIASSAILGAVAYRVMCPAPYVRFATFGSLGEGAGIGMLIMLPAYLAGAACSVVFPGLVGAILTCVAVAVVSVGELVLLEKVLGQTAQVPSWVTAGSWLAAGLAALLTVRFGLTLNVRARVTRFAAVTLVGALLFAVGFPVVAGKVTVRGPARVVEFSPYGNYVLSWERRCNCPEASSWHGAKELRLTRLSDGASGHLRPIPYADSGLHWGPHGQVYYVLTPPHARRAFESQVVIQQMDAGGVVREEAVRVGREGLDVYCSLSWRSPDGRVVMVRCRERQGTRWVRWLEFVDIENARKLDAVIENVNLEDPYYAPTCWWQSNTEVGYIDTEGKRRIVRVVE